MLGSWFRFSFPKLKRTLLRCLWFQGSTVRGGKGIAAPYLDWWLRSKPTISLLFLAGPLAKINTAFHILAIHSLSPSIRAIPTSSDCVAVFSCRSRCWAIGKMANSIGLQSKISCTNIAMRKIQNYMATIVKTNLETWPLGRRTKWLYPNNNYNNNNKKILWTNNT